MEVMNWNELLLPYEQTVDELVVKFRNMDLSYKRLNIPSPIELVEGRIKQVSSILDKAGRKNIPHDEILERIEDIAGIRIITRFVEDIDKVIEIIRNRSGVDLVVKAERDYVANPKNSGYRSYHIIVHYPVFSALGFRKVNCEIQIRTLAMNFWATIEHSINYKYRGRLPEEISQRLISCSDAAAKLDSVMSEIRGELLNAQIDADTQKKLVDGIIDRIQGLYFKAKVEQVAELNRKFIEMFENNDINGLRELDRQLRVMADLYKL